MTDLRIADTIHRAMVADMEGTEAVPAPTLTAEQIDMLRKLGFDHVPTEQELREAKARRQAEVRDEVLFQADRKGWCEDGTRQVLANLRLQRPGDRGTHKIIARVTMDVEVDVAAWTERGALASAIRYRQLPTEMDQTGLRYLNVTHEGLTVDGNPYELTEDLRRELSSDD